ncbi:MAG: type II CAAX endopeptidase family protein [Planctomycetota bacterium]|nr:type II CAAX endopeptidase family protein [Planctomycetota bacterium]
MANRYSGWIWKQFFIRFIGLPSVGSFEGNLYGMNSDTNDMNTSDEPPKLNEALLDETESSVRENEDAVCEEKPEVGSAAPQLLAWFKREAPYVIAAYSLVAVLIVNTVQVALKPGGQPGLGDEKGLGAGTKPEKGILEKLFIGKGKEEIEQKELKGDSQSAPVKKAQGRGGMALNPAQVEQLVKSFPDLAIFVGLMGFVVSASLLIGTGLLGWWILQRLQDREPLEEEGAKLWAICRWGFWDVLKVAVMYLFFLAVTACAIRLMCIHEGLRASYEGLTQVQQGLILQFPGSVLIIGVILYILKSEKGYDLSELGYTFRWKAVGKGILGYFAALPVVLACAFAGAILIQYFGSEQQDHPIAGELLGDNPLWTMGMMVVFACVLAPVWEEIFFRGLLYPAIRKWCSLPVSIVFSAISFSMLHGNLSHLMPIFALGILLAYLYEKTQSIWSCIAAHMVFNTGSMVLLFTMRFMIKRLEILEQGKQVAVLWF